jgi:hypothetical protein
MCSNKIFLSIKVIPSSIIITSEIFHVDLVSQEAADSSEPFNELETFLGLVSDELNLSSIVHVVVAKPFSQRYHIYHLEVDA